MTDLQARIIRLLGYFEELELAVEQGEQQLTPLESLRAGKVIEYRQEQLVILAEAAKTTGTDAKVRTMLASRLGAMANNYDRRLK